MIIIDFFKAIGNFFKRVSFRALSLFKKGEYHSLAPKSNIEQKGKDAHYFEMFDTAVNDISIKNIAVTGGYGSGKSSLIKSYLNKRGLSRKFLFISLANIGNKEKNQNNKNDESIEQNKDIKYIIKDGCKQTNENNDKNNYEIEQSILQQIFYSQKAKKVRSSRFKQIRDMSIWRSIKITLLALGLVTSLGLLFISNFITKYKDIVSTIVEDFKKTEINIVLEKIPFFKNLANNDILINMLPIFFLFICVTIIVYIVFNKYAVSKVNVNTMGLEFKEDKNIDNSILNLYIDELVYFFSKTNYKGIIFEDIDRFENQSIFNKLREINKIINANFENESWNIKFKRWLYGNSNIKFIYALKDEMFECDNHKEKGTQRTKFFDYIIPVIPVITTANSDYKMQELFKDLPEAKRLEDHIFNISAFIKDYRLAKNIFNEYSLYSKIKDVDKNSINKKKQFKNEKILAFSVLKNKYPKKYQELLNDEGCIYNLFHGFLGKLIEVKEKSLTNKIKTIHAQISEIKNKVYENKTDIAYIFYSEVYKNQNSYLNDQNNRSIHVGNEVVNKVALLDRAINGDFDNHNNQVINAINKAKNRMIIINDTAEKSIIALEEQEKVIRTKIFNARKESLSDVLKSVPLEDIKNNIILNHSDDVVELERDKALLDEETVRMLSREGLIYFLLKEGYIDKNYRDYINLEYDKSSDRVFVRNIKTNHDYVSSGEQDNLINWKINNIKRAVRDLDDADLSSKNILSIDFVNKLCKLKNQHKIDLVVSTIINDGAIIDSFIVKYIINNKVSNVLVRSLLVQDIKFFNDVFNDKPKLYDYENFLLTMLVELANLDSDLSLIPNLKEWIIDTVVYDKNGTLSEEGVLNLLLKLGVRLPSLRFISNDSFNSLYNNELYEINVYNLSEICIRTLGGSYDNNKFENSNYKYLNENKEKLSKLWIYLDKNFEEYLSWVAKLGNSYDYETEVLPILNREDVGVEVKAEFLTNTSCHVDKFEDITFEKKAELLKALIEKDLVGNVFISVNNINGEWDLFDQSTSIIDYALKNDIQINNSNNILLKHEILEKIIKNSNIGKRKRIKLFADNINRFNFEQIKIFIKHFGYNADVLFKSLKKHEFDFEEEFRQIFEYLKNENIISSLIITDIGNGKIHVVIKNRKRVD